MDNMFVVAVERWCSAVADRVDDGWVNAEVDRLWCVRLELEV